MYILILLNAIFCQWSSFYVFQKKSYSLAIRRHNCSIGVHYDRFYRPILHIHIQINKLYIQFCEILAISSHPCLWQKVHLTSFWNAHVYVSAILFTKIGKFHRMCCLFRFFFMVKPWLRFTFFVIDILIKSVSREYILIILPLSLHVYSKVFLCFQLGQ